MAANAAGQAAHLLAQTLLRSSPEPQIASALAQTLPLLKQAELRQNVVRALQEHLAPGGSPADDPLLLNALWNVWLQERHPELDNLLASHNRSASRPISLKVVSALRLGQLDWIYASDGLEIVEVLLAAVDDPQSVVSEQARAALVGLQNPLTQEEVCRWAIEHDHLQAIQAALSGDYAPRDGQKRALFFLLTGQWERYQALDFDASLLRALHQAAGDELRARIARQARQAGWGGYVEALTGARSARRLGELDENEWEVILALLGRDRRWEQAWRLAQAAPALWSARLLQLCDEAGWRPAEAPTAQAFADLAQTGKTCLALGMPFEILPGERLALSPQRRTISALAFSPSGNMLASAGADRNIVLYDCQTGETLERLEGHSAAVASLAFSPHGNILASGGADRSVRLWSLDQGQPPRLLGAYAGAVTTLAFSPDGARLADGDPAAIRLWEADSGKLLHLLPIDNGDTLSLGFSPDGAWLASHHPGNSLRLWQTDTGQSAGELMEQVTNWTFSPLPVASDNLLATASTYGQARLWNVPPGALLHTLPGNVDGACLVVAPNGRLLAASHRQRQGDQTNATIQLWELLSGETAGALETTAPLLHALAFSPDSRSLAYAGQSGEVWLQQVSGSRRALQLRSQDTPPRSGVTQQLLCSPTGRQLAWRAGDQLFLQQLQDIGSLLRTPTSLRFSLAGELENLLQQPGLPEVERAWLEFAARLQAWQNRFEIEIEDTPIHIAIGAYDIEIDVPSER
jgi:WD40 repeat protein